MLNTPSLAPARLARVLCFPTLPKHWHQVCLETQGREAKLENKEHVLGEQVQEKEYLALINTSSFQRYDLEIPYSCNVIFFQILLCVSEIQRQQTQSAESGQDYKRHK